MKKKFLFFAINVVLLVVSQIAHGCVPAEGGGWSYFYESPESTTKKTSAEKIHEIIKARIALSEDLNFPLQEIPQGKDRYLSPLIVCCQNPPYLETIKLLLGNKANPNIMSGRSSPISLICSSLSSPAHLEALSLLISAGSCIDGYNFETVSSLCGNPQNEELKKNPELRLEAMKLLLNAKAHIPYENVLETLLNPITERIIPEDEQEILLQERKNLISLILRTNVSVLNPTNPSFFNIDKHKRYMKVEDTLVTHAKNHEKERCRLNEARYRLCIDIVSSQRKKLNSPITALPGDIVRKIIFLSYPTLAANKQV